MLSNAKQIFLTIVAAVVFATAASPQSPVPIEEEFQVNTYTTSYQTDPDLAATSDGDFVVVWNDYSGQDGDPAGIFAQRFDAAGTALGGELQVNAYPTGSQTVPAVTFGTDGGFVVLWMGPGEEDSFGVFGQRFDSAGDESGVNFHVNTYTTGLQGYPSVAPAGDGFLVVWESDQDGDDRGIFAQRFDSDGTHLADEFQVNTTTASGQTNPHVASLAQGDFVVVWTDYGAADGDL
ncbi:MAG: hypothetical protein GY722_28030, partial [bacterium]|nr:hypothetical protein [bacterium]